MKYNYPNTVLRYMLLLAVFGFLGRSNLYAQLSTNTTYVVNGQPDLAAPVDTFANLTGPITGPSYGAMTYLNQYGMNLTQTTTGPVVFLLSSGYNPVEPSVINIGAATGSGGWPNMYWNANSPVIIKPAAGQSFTITTSASIAANTALVRFNGAWYAQIEGSNNGSSSRDLTFLMPTSATQTTSRVIDIMPTTGQRCQFIGVKNCRIVGNSTSSAISTYAGVYMGGASAGTATALGQNQYIDIINNYIIGVQNGVYVRGLSNTVNLQNKFVNINNNIIGDYVNPINSANTANFGGANACGIYANAISNSVISGNTIRNSLPAISSNVKGIFLTSEGNVAGLSCDSNVQVLANNIYNLTTNLSGGVTGIRMNLGTHSQHLRVVIANNSISKLTAVAAQTALTTFAYPVGILIEDVSANVGAEVFFNSINLTGSTLPASSFSACMATAPGTAGGIIMMNNSFANKMGRPITNTTGYTVYGLLTTSNVSPFLYASFNNYYTTTFDGGTAFTARMANIDITSLKGLKMRNRSDSTSYSTIPPFKNDTDLTVNAGTSHLLYNSGVNLSTFSLFYPTIADSIRFKVNVDINGSSRNLSGRFTSIGCHRWVGDSTNNPVGLVAPRTFPINGYTQYPTALNLNGSFATVAEAVDYLNHYGVSGSGAINLEMQPGYNGETTFLPALIDYPQSSLGTPVTFKPANNFSTTISIPNNAAMNNTSIVRFMGANWVSFNGGTQKGITFAMPANATNANSRIISVTPWDTVSNNVGIYNCKLIGNSNATSPNTGMGIYVGHPAISGTPLVAPKSGISNVSFVGNEIGAVRSGIVFFSPGLSNAILIKNNIIGGTIAPGGTENTTYVGGTASQAGVWVKGIASSNIDSNVVRNCVQTAASSNGFFGIYLDEPNGANFASVNVTRNLVYNLVTLSGTYCAGIRVNLSATTGARNISIINNFVGKVLGNGTGLNFSNLNPAGISIDAGAAQANAGIALAHNTINLTGSGLGAANSGSAALFMGANIQGGVESNNNIFGNRINRISASGNRYAVLIGHNQTPFNTNAVLPFGSNNNNYFAVGNLTNFLLAYTNGSVNVNNIINLRKFTASTPALAGMDGNSFNWANTFVTDTTPNIVMINAGLVPGGASIVTGVCTDIYGNARYQCPGNTSTSTRWVGAVEYGTPYPALQGNSTYPINGIDNPPSPLNPTSGSFKTVRQAIDYLNSQGVDDPSFGGFRTIRLEIQNGYVGESDTFMTPITVLDYPRQAATRPVVLGVASGRSDTIKVVSTVNAGIAAGMSLIRLGGCKYFTIDGSNGSGRGITLVLPAVFNTNTNKVIDIISGFNPITASVPTTTNNVIKNCNINGISTTSAVNTFAGIYMGGIATTPSNPLVGQNGDNLFQNNKIEAVQYGIYLRGDTLEAFHDNNNSIVDNIIGGTVAPGGSTPTTYYGGSANAAGIWVQSQVFLNISGNTIQNSIQSFANPRGIELATTAVVGPWLCSNTTIKGNKISNIKSTVAGGAYGIYLNFGNNTNNVSRFISINNNMIWGIEAPGTNASGANFGLNPFGIYMNATTNIGSANSYVGVSMYYNSINLGQSNSMNVANAISACVGIPTFIRDGVLMGNNIFQNRLYGNASTTVSNYAVACGGTVNPFSYSDYNDYFASAVAPSIAASLGSNVSTSAVRYNQWYEVMTFTRQDTMSLTYQAPFTSDNNLYIPSSTSSNLYQAAKGIPGLTTDIDGNPRNSFLPCIGAHEFTGTYLDNVQPRIFNLTDPTSCQSGNILLNFNIYDKQLIGDSLYYKINGGTVQNVQATVSIGTARQYVIPAQPSGTLIEYRLTAYDYPTPPNTGVYPTNKVWDTLSTGITNFPYNNSFEGVNNPAWTAQTTNGNATWEIGAMGSPTNPPLGANTGVKVAIFRSNSFTTGSSAMLVSPCLDLSNMSSPTLRFYMSQNSDLPAKRDSIQVKVSFGGNIFSNALKSVERVNTNYPLPGYRMVEVCLSAFKTSGLRLAIEGFSSGTGQNILIDDIMIYDDVQSQTITPQTFNQCFRDSIRFTVNNTDQRFVYRVIDQATGNILTSKPGEGTNMGMSFMPSSNLDTVRYVVNALNTVTFANNIGFGGGYQYCSNNLPNNFTAIINRFTGGPFVTAGQPFSGSYNAGDANNPDGAKIGDTITYKIVPPSNFTNAQHGSLWQVTNLTVIKQATGQPFTGYTYVVPSASGDGYVRLITPANMLDSNIVFNFTIRLLASNCDSSFSRVLRIATPPTALYTVTPATNQCSGNDIVFNALGSTKPANNFPFTYTWIFGDGTFAYVENPTKQFANPGTYSVRFILTDRYGLSSQYVQNITVLQSPSVDFTTNVPCALDSTVFTPSAQTAGTTYLWSFPYNSTQTRDVAKYNFNQFDTAYEVSLKVTNTAGCFSTIKKSVYVFAKPTANFSTTPHCLSSNVPISNTSTIPVGTIGYIWNWGNGQNSLSATPTYKYPASGTYSATLKATSQFGCVDSVVKTVTVYDRPFANYTTTNPCAGESDVTVFNNSTTFAGGLQNVDYSWQFGDFKTSTATNPTNAYRATGTYTVFMLAVDKINGCRDSVTRNLVIYNKPVAQFATSPGDQICMGNELQTINSSYTVDGGAFKCNWNWGDNTTDTICSKNHTYTTPSTGLTITLITNTANGCSDTATRSLVVSQPPHLQISAVDTNVANFPYCKNQKFLNANLPSAEYYNWSMGDAGNNTASGNNLFFTYSTKGTYTLKCTVKDESGCIVTDSIEVKVECSVGLNSQIASTFDLNAYPNPFGTSTNLSFELPEAANVKITVMDMLGRVISSKDLGQMGRGKHTESLEEFGAAGTYMIKTEINGTAIYKQVVKQ